MNKLFLFIVVLPLAACDGFSVNIGGGSNQSSKGSVTPNSVIRYTPPTITRLYIMDRLGSIFDSGYLDRKVGAVDANIKTNVSYWPTAFGSRCSDYDGKGQQSGLLYHPCQADFGIGLNRDERARPNGNAIFFGELIRICQFLTDNQNNMDFALNKISITSSSLYSDQSAQKIFNQFAPYKTLPSEVLPKFRDLFTQMESNFDRRRAWSTIYYTVCTSNSWLVP